MGGLLFLGLAFSFVKALQGFLQGISRLFRVFRGPFGLFSGGFRVWGFWGLGFGLGFAGWFKVSANSDLLPPQDTYLTLSPESL